MELLSSETRGIIISDPKKEEYYCNSLLSLNQAIIQSNNEMIETNLDILNQYCDIYPLTNYSFTVDNNILEKLLDIVLKYPSSKYQIKCLRIIYYSFNGDVCGDFDKFIDNRFFDNLLQLLNKKDLIEWIFKVLSKGSINSVLTRDIISNNYLSNIINLMDENRNENIHIAFYELLAGICFYPKLNQCSYVYSYLLDALNNLYIYFQDPKSNLYNSKLRILNHIFESFYYISRNDVSIKDHLIQNTYIYPVIYEELKLIVNEKLMIDSFLEWTLKILKLYIDNNVSYPQVIPFLVELFLLFDNENRLTQKIQRDKDKFINLIYCNLKSQFHADEYQIPIDNIDILISKMQNIAKSNNIYTYKLKAVDILVDLSEKLSKFPEKIDFLILKSIPKLIINVLPNIQEPSLILKYLSCIMMFHAHNVNKAHEFFLYTISRTNFFELLNEYVDCEDENIRKISSLLQIELQESLDNADIDSEYTD